MAPSPEKTIEPKAPDKRESASSSDSSCEPANKTSADPKCGGVHLALQDPQDPPALSRLDEGQLKALLEEAITYKCPKDRECKSSLFKELLHEAESIEAPPPLSRTRFQSERNESRNLALHLSKHQRQLSHGGSLQDLAESKLFENSNTKLDNYSSRKNTGAKRKTVSVSARQSEGGSLPSNVNNSSSIYTYDGLFLYDDKLKKGAVNPNRSDANSEPDKELWRADNTKRDYSDTYTTSCEINLLETASSSNSSLLRFSPVPGSLIDPDVIEECQAALLESTIADDEKQVTACDMISAEQEKSTNDERSGLILKLPRINYTSHAELHVNMENNNENGGAQSSGDEVTSTIQFSQLESTVVTAKPVQRPGGGPYSWFTSVGLPALLHDDSKKSLDENGNSLQSFNATLAACSQQNYMLSKLKREKPKQKKADRNVKVIRSEEVVGHRNETNIDLLVKFIEENDANPKKSNGISKMGKGNYNKSDYVNNKQRQYLEEKNKKKEGNRKNNKERNLFKSNSLEEVSCSMLEDLTNHNSNITMRNKSKKVNTASANDRRSWGEVSYVAEDKFNTVDCKNVPHEPHIVVANESATCNYAEFAEFHVVTKKKKPKKYHKHNIFNNAGKMNLQRNDYYHNHVSKYQANDFTSNHDLYMNRCKIPEQRRKSTSSMPPSDKSDTSDLDSVHSLPVESTSKKLSVRQVSTSSGGTPQASYADIARMANVTGNDHCNDLYLNDKWGSSQAKAMFPSLIESTTSNEKGNHPKTMSLTNYNFPDLIESCHYYSEVQKKKENEENNKEKQDTTKTEKSHSKLKLAQSKSVDNDDICTQSKKSALINKPFKENLKHMKTKSEISVNREQTNDSKMASCKVNANPKHCKKLNSIDAANLTQVVNNKHEFSNSANNSDKTTSDLVSDCIHRNSVSVKTNSNSNTEVKHCIPAVIILDEDFNLDEPASNDIVFGFELNEKLLSGELSDSDCASTIIFHGNGVTDVACLHEDFNVEHNSNLPSSDIVVKNEGATCNLPKITSELKNEKSAGHNNSLCDNQDLKNEFRLNNKKCLDTIQFIPPANAGGFQNHDKIVNFIGIAWDEILKGGKAQYYTG